MRYVYFLLPIVTVALTACGHQGFPPKTGEKKSSSAPWRAERYTDDFTDVTVCRAERDIAAERAEHGLPEDYVSYHFFAEMREGKPRAGVRSFPPVPLPGDVQMRAGAQPAVTLELKHAPLDSVHSLPHTLDDICSVHDGNTDGKKTLSLLSEDDKNAFYRTRSPYRVLEGKEATDFINAVLKEKQTIYRLIGVNTAYSFTGAFTPDGSFKKALEECGLAGEEE